MSILNKIFGQNPAPVQQPATTPAQPATPPNQGNIPAAPTVPVDPNNPTNPVTPPATVEEPKSPLDQYSTLWDTPPVDENNPAPAEPTPLTAEQIAKAVGNANFSSAITPETMTAITAGGEDAATAFTTAMNEVAKQVMIQATLVNNKLTEKAVADATAAQQAKIPELLRQQAITTHAKDTNPIFNNPAVKPVVAALQTQLAVKFPNATPSELTTMAEDFITTMGDSIKPKEVINDNSGAGTDWESFLQS